MYVSACETEIVCVRVRKSVCECGVCVFLSVGLCASVCVCVREREIYVERL